MRNARPLFLFLVFSFLMTLGSALSGQPKSREGGLPEQYRDWLKLVSYIILPVEKEVFLKLTTDRDRDIFIETFWKQRDPTPGTPENEYKDEHIRRFNYANKFYGRGTTKEGWQTDMGRIYIILGPPASIERFETTIDIVPCQAWSYYGDPSKDLPPHFVLLFYQKGGIGDYKLYDPVSDGPAALLLNKRDIDATDYEDLYERIKERAPTLADLSISLVPGEYYYGDYTPSPQNNIIMANIFQSPRKDVNPAYATHFLEYKGIVSTEYLTNYIESDATVSLLEDPLTGLPFVHFVLAPKSMSYGYYEPKEQYYSNFRMDVSLRHGEKIIFQYNKDYSINFVEKELGRIQANGISIEDSFPAIEGQYRLIVLLQNSVGKEFSLYEKDITIPAREGRPRLSGPILGYKLEKYGPQIHIPFKVLDRKLVVDPKNTFGLEDELVFSFNVVDCSEEVWRTGEVTVGIRGMREVNPTQKSLRFKLNNASFSRVINFLHSLPLTELSPDYYEIQLTLQSGGGAVFDEVRANFVVSPEKVLPHPIANAKGFPLSNQHVYHHMLARQYDTMNLNEKAEREYQLVYDQAPGYKEGILDYANFLLKVGQFDRALEVNEKLREESDMNFEYLLIRGKAQMGRGDYGRAIDSFLEANKIYNSDVRLLNSLGFCYYKTGEKKKALETLGASLRLNPDQEEIKKLVQEIGKR
ncbi:MAG: GWxTD domain-containing protein [Candidatus Aminicenantales bacterium]